MTADKQNPALVPTTYENADMSDPKQFAAWAVSWFPDPRKGAAGTLVPMPMAADTAPVFSEQLHELGFRHHPELMTKFPIPGSNPGMGWYNAPQFVGEREYNAYRATHSAPTPSATADATAENALQQMLSAMNPELAERISAMTPEEKAAALPEAERAAAPAIERLAKLNDLLKRGGDA